MIAEGRKRGRDVTNVLKRPMTVFSAPLPLRLPFLFLFLILTLLVLVSLLPPPLDLSTHIYERKNKTIPGVVVEEARERKPSRADT